MLPLKSLLARERYIPALIVLLAAILRLILLGIKPPHFDEGVNGWFVDSMIRTGFFRYDPTNYHGPMHFYVLFLFQTLFGRHVWALRLPMAVVSAASVFLVTKFDRFVDRRACWFAALAMAVSPAAMFYGRYAIHESWLVFFLMLFVWGGAGLWKFGTTQYLWATGIAVAGMILTKETYVIHLACFSIAMACMILLEWVSPSEGELPVKQSWSSKDLTAVMAVGVGAILFFYSGGFFDVSALSGLWRTYAAWFHKGQGGEGHDKDWWYWLSLFARYEWPALAALILSARWLLPGCNRLLRLLAIYGCGTLAAYSIIHYKTPWCIISLLWPFFFLFGALVADVLRFRIAWVGVTAASITAAASLLLAVRLNFFHYTDEAEPYVYVQTFTDIRKLTQPLFALAQRGPDYYQLTGNVILSSYHPLPWILGDFPNVGFYDDERAPEQSDADFLIVDNSRIEEVERKLKGTYFTEEMSIRGGIDPAMLYLNAAKFRDFVAKNRRPEFSPMPEEPGLKAPPP